MITMMKDGELKEFPVTAKKMLENHGWMETDKMPTPIKIVNPSDVPEEVKKMKEQETEAPKEVKDAIKNVTAKTTKNKK